MKIKSLVLLALAMVLFVGCKRDGSTTIVINASNYQAEKINVAWMGEDGEYKVEGVEIVDGKGSITIDVAKYTKLALAALDSRAHIMTGMGFIPGPSFQFFAQPGSVEITFDMDEWPILTIEGGKDNADLQRYWSEYAPLEKERFELTRIAMSSENDNVDPQIRVRMGEIADAANDIQHNFIVNNPNSILSLDLLSMRELKYSIVEFEQLFNSLDKEIREIPGGVDIAKRLNISKATQPGNPAPDFNKVDKDGNSVTLADYKGSYLLIDFWGTWCMPCRNSHPHLVQLYNKYSPKGLKFLNVAQESSLKDRDKWLKAIEEDGLVWTQILNNEGIEECDMVKKYSIKAFPSKVLVDDKGNIVKSWIGDSDEVDKKLTEIFGE